MKGVNIQLILIMIISGKYFNRKNICLTTYEVLCTGAFLRHFKEYTLLKGSGSTPPVWGHG